MLLKKYICLWLWHQVKGEGIKEPWWNYYVKNSEDYLTGGWRKLCIWYFYQISFICSSAQQVKHWDPEVLSREKLHWQGSQTERGENKSLVCYHKDKGLEVFTSWQGPVRHLVTGGSQLEIRKRWGNCGFVQAQGRHVLLNGRHVHKMAVWACSEGGVFDSLKTKGHWADTPASPFRELVVLTSLNRLELKLGTAYPKFLKNNLNKHLII